METGSFAVVFPGQGSQRTGMAQDFYDQYPTAKRTFEEASDAAGEDLTALCFQEDPRLDLTEFTQPAILTAEIAMFRVLQETHGFSPSYFAGHSLGEYTALVAAEVIPFTDAVKIVRKRGALMQGAVPAGVGSMAAVIMNEIDSPQFREIVSKNGAELANVNSLEQIVISGKKEAVEAAGEELAKTYGESVNVVPLPVSAPFHSSMMQVIEGEFKEFIGGFEPSFKKENSSKVVSNFSSEFHQADTLIENLVKQISGSVKWVENMRLLSGRAEKIIEVGPNRPLGKFFKSVGVDVPSVINVRGADKLFKS